MIVSSSSPVSAQGAHERGDPAVDRGQGLELAPVAIAQDRAALSGDRRLAADDLGLVGDVVLEHARQPGQLGVGEAAEIARRRHRLAAAGAAAVGVDVLDVRRRLPHLQVERLLPGHLPQVLIGPLVDHIGQVLAAILLLALLALDREVEVEVSAAVADLDRPAVPSRRDLVLVVDGALVAVQELADVGGLIASSLQPHGEHVLGLREGPVAGLVREHPVVVAVLAGEQGSSRRTAERGGVEVVGEGRPAVTEQAGRPRHRLAAVRGVVLVVGEHEDDVRLSAEGRRRLDRRVGVLATATARDDRGCEPEGREHGPVGYLHNLIFAGTASRRPSS